MRRITAPLFAGSVPARHNGERLERSAGGGAAAAPKPGARRHWGTVAGRAPPEISPHSGRSRCETALRPSTGCRSPSSTAAPSTASTAPEVTVEVHLANGLPSFTLVGLADTEVKEARERVRAALHEQRPRFPAPTSASPSTSRPADLPKESGRFDLPIARRHPRRQRPARPRAPRSLRVRRRALAGGRAAAGARRARDEPRAAPPGAGQPAARAGAAAVERAGSGPGRRLDHPWRRPPARRGARADAAGAAEAAPWAPVRPQRCRTPARLARLRRGEGPGGREARARDRGGGPAERADGRSAGQRQVDAGAALRRRCCRR